MSIKNNFELFQAKYDAKQVESKQTILPYSQNSWQDRTGYTILQNGDAAKPLNGFTIVNGSNNNSFVYNSKSSSSNLLFV